MGEIKQFVGQPVLSQILDSIPTGLINAAKSTKHWYYKRIPLRAHLVTIMECLLLQRAAGTVRRDAGLCRKLTHLVLTRHLPAAPSLMPIIIEATWYLTIYFELISNTAYLGQPVKRIKNRNLKIIDSTIIRLFSDILRGVGRNTLDGSRKKGGIKMHTMMDAFSSVAEFVQMTEARVHDRKIFYHIDLPGNSFMVFDKAYNLYSQFDKWTKQKVWFITRMKDNAVYHVTKILLHNSKHPSCHVL